MLGSGMVLHTHHWQWTTGNGQQETGNGQQTTGNGQQTPGNGQQTTGNGLESILAAFLQHPCSILEASKIYTH